MVSQHWVASQAARGGGGAFGGAKAGMKWTGEPTAWLCSSPSWTMTLITFPISFKVWTSTTSTYPTPTTTLPFASCEHGIRSTKNDTVPAVAVLSPSCSATTGTIAQPLGNPG